MCRSSCGSGRDGTGPRHAARRKREPSLLAGRAADADAVREAGVHAHVPEGIGAVGVLRAELSAGEAPVVDGDLVRTGAPETRALADARTTAYKRAILPADARAGALRIGRARRADAVARVAAVVATRVTVGAVAVARAGDPGLAGRRRWVALGGIARDERYGEPVGAIGLELGDAAEAGDEAGEVADRAAAGRPARHLDRGAIGGDADRRRRQVIATPAAAVAAATGGADGGRRVRRCRGDRRARPAVAGIRARVLVEAAQASVPALPQGLRLGDEEARRLLADRPAAGAERRSGGRRSTRTEGERDQPVHRGAADARETDRDVRVAAHGIRARAVLEVRAAPDVPSDGGERVVVRRPAASVHPAARPDHPGARLLRGARDAQGGRRVVPTFGAGRQEADDHSVRAAFARLRHRLDVVGHLLGDLAPTAERLAARRVSDEGQRQKARCNAGASHSSAASSAPRRAPSKAHAIRAGPWGAVPVPAPSGWRLPRTVLRALDGFDRSIAHGATARPRAPHGRRGLYGGAAPRCSLAVGAPMAAEHTVTRRLPPPTEHSPVARPRTWLAVVGWRKDGLVGLDERPRSAPRRSPSAIRRGRRDPGIHTAPSPSFHVSGSCGVIQPGFRRRRCPPLARRGAPDDVFSSRGLVMYRFRGGKIAEQRWVEWEISAARP